MSDLVLSQGEQTRGHSAPPIFLDVCHAQPLHDVHVRSSEVFVEPARRHLLLCVRSETPRINACALRMRAAAHTAPSDLPVA